MNVPRSSKGERAVPPPSSAIASIAADASLTRAAKIERLVDMGQDARALEVASGEGMSGSRSELKRIRDALRSLGFPGRPG